MAHRRMMQLTVENRVPACGLRLAAAQPRPELGRVTPDGGLHLACVVAETRRLPRIIELDHPV
jgi:hypothetical protein